MECRLRANAPAAGPSAPRTGPSGPCRRCRPRCGADGTCYLMPANVFFSVTRRRECLRWRTEATERASGRRRDSLREWRSARSGGSRASLASVSRRTVSSGSTGTSWRRTPRGRRATGRRSAQEPPSRARATDGPRPRSERGGPMNGGTERSAWGPDSGANGPGQRRQCARVESWKGRVSSPMLEA